MKRWAFCALVLASACKDGAEPSIPADATVKMSALLDPALGLELDVPMAWSRKALREDVILEAERKSRQSVPPRLMVLKTPLDEARPTEDVLREAIEAVKRELPPAKAKIHRVTTQRWDVAGVMVAQFDVRYTVLDRKGGAGQAVIQRTAIAVVPDREDVPHRVEVVVTWLDKGDEALGTEVDRMLRSLRFLRGTK